MVPSRSAAAASLDSTRHAPGRFIPPMLLLRTSALPEGADWRYELKLDGYRAIAFTRSGAAYLRSRNDKAFEQRYPEVVAALANAPADTVLDGEIVALDADGRPTFTALQNAGSAPAPVVYYVFDLLVLRGRDVMSLPFD